MTASPFLALPGAVAGSGVDSSVAAHYGNPLREQRLLLGGGIVDLSNRGVLSVTGPDRLSWLDSVTSQSLKGLPVGGSAETLLLDPSGRIEHAIRVFDDGVTAWLLVDQAETQSLYTWLDRMRFMLRVEVADRSEEFATVGWMPAGDSSLESTSGAGVAGSAAAVEAFTAAPNGVPLVWRDPWSAVVAGGHQYAEIDEHPGASYGWCEVLVERDVLPALAAAVSRGDVEVAGTLAAEALRIAAWRPRLATESDERLIPHEVDWIRSAVHLNKGCYRGQETVAKVHNLGHPPRRLVLLHLDGSDSVLPAPGDEVFVGGELGGAEAIAAPGGAGADGAGADGVAGAPAPAGAAAVPQSVGVVTASAQHFELGPIALAIVKRTTPVDAELAVASDGILVAAAQEVIVPPEAGAAVGRIPRLPRLGAQRR
ncbi:CAF17-like 4Fe-4S cluster assembly/insertion protein YgfZ [Subtercola endophyticus]|uniref:CAF17-like 4Fe-4S cluster assembly/insertion protein YgfZ n=1 Tax=Subtercola endophyticus TaxID=2895559 RepID=UPI001E5B5F94|nr:folate-binding protein [Subtercola endophyticus]UFS59517.1 folate-binding protein [Subtercola endophyticus]